MTSCRRPNFIDSPFFVSESGNWHLKPGAPKDVVREFKAFMQDTEPLIVPSLSVAEVLAILIKEGRKREKEVAR